MNLHRHSGTPEWENTSAGDRNYWQKLAHKTNGLLTPPNIATIIGFIIVLFGLVFLLERHYVAAAVAIAIGRFFDVIDGWIAERTGTKSPFGEGLDAVADKVSAFLILPALIVSHAAPAWAVIAILLPQIVTFILIYFRRKQNHHTHASRAGKYGVALSWVAISGFVLISGLQPTNNAFYVLCSLLTAISVLLSSSALRSYSQSKPK
jgi:phosphatidylglycerophosphate synthase